MYTVRSYQFPQSVEEAYQLLQKDPKNTLMGGCNWLKMGHKRIHQALDLTRLGLDQIEARDGKIFIGAFTTLRQLETSPLLQERFGGILPQCVQGVVGVQMRNSATVGASVFSRYGFSDVLTALLALSTTVMLHGGGALPLEEFLEGKCRRDILTGLIIEDDGCVASYHSMRNTATDFPLLAVAVAKHGQGWKISVGARPARAALAKQAASLLNGGGTAVEAGKVAAQELAFATNLRAGAEYRSILARVLVARAVTDCARAGEDICPKGAFAL